MGCWHSIWRAVASRQYGTNTYLDDDVPGKPLTETVSHENEIQKTRKQEGDWKSANQRLTKTNTSLENELRQMKSDLELKEKELKSAGERLAETKATYENELHQMRSALRENENLKSDIKRLTDLKISQEKEIQKIRSALVEKEQVKSTTERLTEIKATYEKEIQRISSTLRQKEEKVKSLDQSLSDMEKNLVEAKSVLRNKEEELKSVNNRLTKTKASHQNDLYHMRSELKQKEEEVKSLKQRLQESADVRSSPQPCNPQGCEHKESITQMDTFYKKKLNEARSAVAQKEKELKSVKDRLAAQVAASLKTGDTESMNNPVSKTRLTEMYDNLKLLQWPKVKDQLKSRKMNPKEAKDLIQKTFGNASDEMKRRRQQIEEMFQQSESSSGPTPQKVKEYRQLTVQNLQMALFHTNKEELLKTGFPECLDEFPEEVKVDLRPLTSECYWLSCLMALNNPPLQPDWKNHVPGFDPWDIFPREIKPSVM